VLLAKMLDVLSGSSGLLFPSSSSSDSGARVQAGAEVSVLVPVPVVVVSKPGTDPQTVTVASIKGMQMEEINVDDVPMMLVGRAETLYPSVHETKRSVITVFCESSHSFG
jgi:hypothetical protein